MSRLDVAAYVAELDAVLEQPLPWEALSGKTVALSGATGMIGSFLTDVLMRGNEVRGLGLQVVALGRSEDKARERLPHFGRDDFRFVTCDVCALDAAVLPQMDFLLHLASSTHPRQYSANPIGTIRANVDGLTGMLEWASASREAGREGRLVFTSSVEVYGENRGDVERFDEGYLGYIDCNTLRACYTESKRVGEALCQAWRAQRGVEAVIARIARVYGPTLQGDDSKALSQFMHRSLAGESVVLKSAGTQRYSYLHVADAAAGLLWVLLAGADGEAYNLADEASDVRLRDLAALVAEAGGVDVELGEPDAAESAGFSKATVALMDGGKARELGWRARYDIAGGIAETLAIMREMAL